MVPITNIPALEPEVEIEEDVVVGTISDSVTTEILVEIRPPFSGVVTLIWCNSVVKSVVQHWMGGKSLNIFNNTLGCARNLSPNP